MKKIIFVHLLNDYSGSPKVLSQVIKSCEDKGFQIELYTGKSSEGFLSNVTKSHHFYLYKRFENKIGTLFTFVFSQMHLFLKLLKYSKEDVLIYINTVLPFGAALSGKLMGKPVFYHIHETSIKPQLLKQFLRFIVQKTASKIIFVSNTLKDTESFENREQKTIYNALDSTFAKKGLNNNYVAQDENGFFNVLMICSLKAYKGVEEFLKIAALCQDFKNLKFILVLNVSQKEIDSYFSTIPLSKNTTIVATQKDLHPFYQNANLALNLSRIDQWVETFGLTIIEAMSYGIPVIVPPVGGPAEIVTNGKEGYLISSYQTNAIAEKIMALSQNEQKCMELSKMARKRSLFFNEEKFKREISAIVND